MLQIPKVIKVLILCLCLLSTGAVAVYAQTYSNPEQQAVYDNYKRKHMITLAATACSGVYEPGIAPELGYMRDYGWKIVPHTVEKSNLEVNFMVAKNKLRETQTDIYMIAFRGSNSKKDWQVNLEVAEVPFGGTNLEEFQEYAKLTKRDKNIPMVHRGFNDYVNTVLGLTLDTDGDGIEENFIEELYNNRDMVVIITGHSLGGAVATLLSERLVSMGIDKNRIPVITFGAPAIGNAVFAEMYGDKINLLRIVNNADPVPGSLQTFFGGYKQFGEQYKYKLSSVLSAFQHNIGMYVDYSMREYYMALDAAEAAGIKEKLPLEKFTEGIPKIAIWITCSKEINKRDYVPDIQRFIVNEYQMLFPSYVIMQEDLLLKDQDNFTMGDFYKKARAVGAEYVLILDIDGRIVPQSKKWYINLNQSLFKSNGQLVTMNSFSRLVSPVSGNIQAATFALEQSKLELRTLLPFILQDQKTSLRGL